MKFHKQLGHKSYEPGMAAYKKIIEEFGEGMYSLLCQTVDQICTISSLAMPRNDSSSLLKFLSLMEVASFPGLRRGRPGNEAMMEDSDFIAYVLGQTENYT